MTSALCSTRSLAAATLPDLAQSSKRGPTVVRSKELSSEELPYAVMKDLLRSHWRSRQAIAVGTLQGLSIFALDCEEPSPHHYPLHSGQRLRKGPLGEPSPCCRIGHKYEEH
jgi:hypothetical protein